MPLRRLAVTSDVLPSPDVQQTTFSYDVLGRYICSTWEDATQQPDDIDVVVIGSGMYGGYCAAKIFQLSSKLARDKTFFKPLRVLVLEAGPFLVPEHTQNLPSFGLFDPAGAGTVNVGSGSNPGSRNLVWGVGWRSNQPFVGQAYCVGGKSIYWGGWCPRLTDTDLAQWPQEVLDYFLNRTVGERPITHVDSDNNVLLRDAPLAGYETLEYEIGVKPPDDFVFDPVGAEAPNPNLMGLNQALRRFLLANQGRIETEARTALGANAGLRLRDVQPAPIAVQTQSYISGLFSLDKYSSLPALIAATREDHGDGRSQDLRLALVPSTHAVQLLCEPHAEAPQAGSRVVSRIKVKHEGVFKELAIPAHCQVVLALGSIESTRLALESFSLRDSGLVDSRAAERMGRNFMIHLRADIRFSIERQRLAAFVPTIDPTKQLADLLQLASMHIQCDGPNGRFQYQLYAATNANGPDENMYKMIPDLEVQNAIKKGFDKDMIKLVLRGSTETIGGRDADLGDTGFDFLDLAGDADADQEFGHRRAWVQFRNHDNDTVWKDLHDMGHAIARILANGGALNYDGDNSLPAMRSQQGPGTTFHDSGTLWMGDDPDRSVTDVNGHFHHVTNAYCCDQALFPTVGSANPVLTGLVLARKVADDLVGRHGSRTLQPSETAGFQSIGFQQNWLQAPYNGMALILGSIFETRPTDGIGIGYLDQVFADFELKIEWKAYRPADGSREIPNAGVLLRMPDPSQFDLRNESSRNQFYGQSIEVQIDESGKNYKGDRNPQAIFGDSRFKTGAVYGIAPARQWAAKALAPEGSANYWNVYHVRVQGPNVEVILNDKPVCQAVLPAGARTDGRIGLQFHSGKVQFRNLFVKQI